MAVADATGLEPQREPQSDDVRWLTAAEQGYWRSYVLGTARLGEALSRQLDRDAGLSMHEYEILVRLSEAPYRSLRMAELASSLVHSRSRVTHTVSRLEQRGLIERSAATV